MPELPEVEVVRRGLASLIEARKVDRVTVLEARSVRRHRQGVDDFINQLRGRTFCKPNRRGKYLWIPFSDGDALLAHLGMSGQFRINDRSDELLPHTRVVFDFVDSPTQLRFVDQRMFGGLAISQGGAKLPGEITHIAADPFSADYDLQAVANRIVGRRSTIKRSILDQTIVSGIGNIYADESLWRAKTHFDTPTRAMSVEQVRSVLSGAKEVMSEALLAGGTSFDALYVNVEGSGGYFERELAVYGRQDEPCKRCGMLIVRQKFANRSSFFCPNCQIMPS